MKTMLIALSLVCLASCSKEESHIHGNISLLPDTQVYLQVYEKSLRIIDSTSSVGGEFQFTIPDILPDLLFIQFKGYSFLVPVIVDGAEVSVSGNVNYPEDIEVSGTAPNDALLRFRRSAHTFEVMLRTIDMELGIASDSVVINELTSKRLLHQARFNNLKYEFVVANRGSLVSALLVQSSINDSTSLHQIDSMKSELEPTMGDNAFLNRIERKRTEIANRVNNDKK